MNSRFTASTVVHTCGGTTGRQPWALLPCFVCTRRGMRRGGEPTSQARPSQPRAAGPGGARAMKPAAKRRSVSHSSATAAELRKPPMRRMSHPFARSLKY